MTRVGFLVHVSLTSPIMVSAYVYNLSEPRAQCIHTDLHLRTSRDLDAQCSDNYAITSAIHTCHNWTDRGHVDQETDVCRLQCLRLPYME